MGRDRVPGPADRHHRGGHKAKRRAPGLEVEDRDGHWHIVGTLRVAGRSVRVRRSTGLAARPELKPDAEALRDQWATEKRNEVVHGVRPSVPLSIAAREYLTKPREKPINACDLAIVQEVVARFGTRDMSRITGREWVKFVDERHAGNQSSTRERYLGGLCAFLNWCRQPVRGYIEHMPPFERDPGALMPRAAQRRRVVDLRPDLIMIMIEQAPPHLRAQLIAEWSTGARVSSLLYGCRLADLSLVPGKEQLIFQHTKNGDQVKAALHPWAAEQLAAYLKHRGRLQHRDQPLFLTDRHRPYKDNAKAYGGQNKTAYTSMRRRAVTELVRRARFTRWHMLRAGDVAGAAEVRVQAIADARLLRQVTQHWFRHMIATNLLSQQVDPRTIMEQSGWRDVRSLMRYAHAVRDVQRQAVAKLPIGVGVGPTYEPTTRRRTGQ